MPSEPISATSLRATARWLLRLAQIAIALAFVACVILLASGPGLIGQLGGSLRLEEGAELSNAWEVIEAASLVRGALSVVSWTMPIALLAGIGAAVMAHRASVLSAEEDARRRDALRRSIPRRAGRA